MPARWLTSCCSSKSSHLAIAYGGKAAEIRHHVAGDHLPSHQRGDAERIVLRSAGCNGCECPPCWPLAASPLPLFAGNTIAKAASRDHSSVSGQPSVFGIHEPGTSGQSISASGGSTGRDFRRIGDDRQQQMRGMRARRDGSCSRPARAEAARRSGAAGCCTGCLARDLQLQAVARLDGVEDGPQLDLEFVDLAGLEQILLHERMERPARRRARRHRVRGTTPSGCRGSNCAPRRRARCLRASRTRPCRSALDEA